MSSERGSIGKLRGVAGLFVGVAVIMVAMSLLPIVQAIEAFSKDGWRAIIPDRTDVAELVNIIGFVSILFGGGIYLHNLGINPYLSAIALFPVILINMELSARIEGESLIDWEAVNLIPMK